MAMPVASRHGMERAGEARNGLAVRADNGTSRSGQAVEARSGCCGLYRKAQVRNGTDWRGRRGVTRRGVEGRGRRGAKFPWSGQERSGMAVEASRGKAGNDPAHMRSGREGQQRRGAQSHGEERSGVEGDGCRGLHGSGMTGNGWAVGAVYGTVATGPHWKGCTGTHRLSGNDVQRTGMPWNGRIGCKRTAGEWKG